jgi:hypothetical protein
MTTNTKEVTQVSEVDVDIDSILGVPGAESVMTPNEDADNKKKPNVFTNTKVDTTFLDTANNTDDPAPAANDDPGVTQNKSENPDSFLDNPEIGVDDPKTKGGRPNAMVSAAKKLIEKGTIVPFDDGKDVSEYTEEDFIELYEANIDHIQKKSMDVVANEFFESLPSELQQAYEYLAKGGTDMKGMFQALASARETLELDITSKEGQKKAVRAYLQATNYGTPEEIEDEIYALEDRGDLGKKANQFKPKLDAMQQQLVNQKIAQQELQARQRAAQSQKYIENVYSTLEKGELNGITLDNKVQNMLYAGLVQSNYPSITGKQTNMLGHLLEKYQWVEPRHDLIAEALWLLADPDGYKKNISTIVKKETNAETVRKLKTEQSTMRSTTAEEGDERTVQQGRTLSGFKAPKRNFFSR